MFENLRWVANLSLLFTELPLLERPAAAREAGFTEVEFWWPFGTNGRPSDREVDAFTDAVQSAGTQLTAMNLFGGDMAAGERGTLSYPDRRSEFQDSVDIAMDIAQRLGTTMFNAPYGHRREGLDAKLQDQIADESLAYAANKARTVGGIVMLEPLSGMPRYPMKSSLDALEIIERVRENTGVDNLGYLLDQFHLMMNGYDVLQDAAKYAKHIAHVQIADTPGRGVPGSGKADIEGMIRVLLENGYTGVFALEYIPRTDTSESLREWRRNYPHWTNRAFE